MRQSIVNTESMCDVRDDQGSQAMDEVTQSTQVTNVGVHWRVAAMVWMIPTLLGATTSYTFTRLLGTPIAFWRALAISIPIWYFWALATPVIFWLGRVARVGWPIAGRALAVHVLASLVAALADVVCGTTIAVLIGAETLGPRVGQQYLFNFMSWLLTGMLTYWVVLGAGYALDFSRKFQKQQLRSSELAAQLARAELAALRAQLHPHFLFNTLNTAVSLVRSDQAGSAVRVLTRLSDILRRLLRDATSHEITLSEELAFLAAYVEIEKIRFADRLTVVVSAEESVLDALVPNLLLQPLVENAVRYGIGGRTSAGRIEVCAERRGDELVLQVRDDGPGLPREVTTTSEQGGVGLSNTQARLEQLYGRAHEFILGSTTAGGAEVTVVIPFQLRKRGATAAAEITDSDDLDARFVRAVTGEHPLVRTSRTAVDA